MPAISLKAHFDGQNILLDEHFNLPRDAQLLVTVLSIPSDSSLADWSELSADGLARGYGESEPVYKASDIIP